MKRDLCSASATQLPAAGESQREGGAAVQYIALSQNTPGAAAFAVRTARLSTDK
jgi:hypothetical protein